MKNLFGSSIPQQTNFRQPDTLVGSSFYKNLDWHNTVIGGSYALHQFTGDTEWQPDDVDVFVATDDLEDFRSKVQVFAEKSNGSIVKFNDFSDPDFQAEYDRTGNRRDEKFHELVLASTTLDVPDCDRKIQFIYLYSDSGRSPESILVETTDLPSCVCYKVDPWTQQKIFFVPEKGREALFTRKVPLEEVCKSRFEKYSKRGFDFY